MGKRTSKAPAHVCTTPSDFAPGDPAVVISTAPRALATQWHGEIVIVKHVARNGSVVVIRHDDREKPHAPTLSTPAATLQLLPLQ